MYDNHKILVIIPARGGSKGIPHKNITNLCGKPLIAYTIEAARKSHYVDNIIVSTDSQEIAEISEIYGAEVPFLRPVEFASDTSKTIDAIVYTLKKLENSGISFDCLVVLQPTAPLRNEDDIDSAIEKFYLSNQEAVVSVSEVDDHPILIRTIKGNSLCPLLNESSTCRRQDMSKYYRVNGCIYINAIHEINENTSFNDNPLPYIMPKERSVDIDNFSDLYMAEYYLKKNKKV